jgi:uncharacterized protein
MLYCDTSALLELYIEEAHSDNLRSHVTEAPAVAVCRIAWAEAYAAQVLGMDAVFANLEHAAMVR